MTDADLVRQIRLGEDGRLEYKQIFFAGNRVTDPKRDEVADTLAALANGRGGTFVLGVDDKTREIIGIPLARLDTAGRWIREICNDLIKPPLDNSDIRKVEVSSDDGELVAIIRADVPRSLFVHGSPGGYYRRLGDSTRRLHADSLARLFQERSQSRVIRFDESVVPWTTPEHLDGSLTERFLRDDVAATEDTLRKLRIVSEDPEDVARLTLAGVLLCTPDPQQWLPHAQIQAVSYAGERHDVNYQSDARDVNGPLDTQISEALHFVRRNMLVRATKGTARVEWPQFSERAVFEALVNAVAHRDYSMAGARVRLHLFADRLELYVPGELANTLTTDSLHLRQANRNELIVSLLGRCPAPEGLGRSRLMDRRGDGVPIILQESQELSGRCPEYTLIDDSELRLIIWAASPVEADVIEE
jgi:predicted HTH transcriptional regulator